MIVFLTACDTYNENDHSLPVPDTFSGRVVDESGNGISGVVVDAFIHSARRGIGPEGVPRDRIARFVKSETDSIGKYSFDFRPELKKIAAEFPSYTPVLYRTFGVKINGFKEIEIKFVGDTNFVVKKSELQPSHSQP